MNNFNSIWKKFLTEGKFDQKIPQKDEKTIIKLENKERLLKEITEDELEHIRRAIDEIPPDEMAFNRLFDGKMRLVIDFPVIDSSNELGRFINLWQKMGYTADWGKGAVEGERILRDNSPEGFAARILAQSLGKSTKPRKIKMKIGKWLSKMLEYRTKYEALRRKVKDYYFEVHGRMDFTGNQIEKALGEQDYKNYYRLESYLYMMARSADGPYPDEVNSVDSIQGLVRYWQENAAYIKKNIDKAIGNQYSIIVTRNPIDILRMSDFEDITSCHSPPSRGGAGEYYKCAVAEAHGHGAIAYVVETEDLLLATNTGNIESAEQEIQDGEIFGDTTRMGGAGFDIEPVSRLRLRQVRYYRHQEQSALMKKYGTIGDLMDLDISEEEKDALIARIRASGEFNPYEGIELAVPESRVYGSLIPGFHKRVLQWAQENQSEQLKDAPRNLDASMEKYGEESWEFGTLDLNSFIKFGGSYEDNRISLLVQQLFGEKTKSTGNIKQNTDTEDELDVNLVQGLMEQYENEILQIDQQYNERMASGTVDGTVVDDGDGGVYIALGASLKIIWDDEEWITWPSTPMITYALEELSQWFSWVNSDYVNQFELSSLDPVEKTIRSLNIDIIPNKLADWSQEYAYSPDDYGDFCEVFDQECDDKREAIKLILTNFFKREEAMKGGAIISLGHTVINDDLNLYHWEAEAEEGYEMDEFEFVLFTAHPEVFYADLGASDDEADQIFHDRNYWLEIRKRMTKPAFENTGYEYYPEIPLDMELLGIHGTEGESQELNLSFSVHDDAPDEQVKVLRNLVDIWDDQDEINRVASEVFRDMMQGRIARVDPGSKVGPIGESHKIDELNILRIERMLTRL
jgi:hypothetical protein